MLGCAAWPSHELAVHLLFVTFLPGGHILPTDPLPKLWAEGSSQQTGMSQPRVKDNLSFG